MVLDDQADILEMVVDRLKPTDRSPGADARHTCVGAEAEPRGLVNYIKRWLAKWMQPTSGKQDFVESQRAILDAVDSNRLGLRVEYRVRRDLPDRQLTTALDSSAGRPGAAGLVARDFRDGMAKDHHSCKKWITASLSGTRSSNYGSNWINPSNSYGRSRDRPCRSGRAGAGASKHTGRGIRPRGLDFGHGCRSQPDIDHRRYGSGQRSICCNTEGFGFPPNLQDDPETSLRGGAESSRSADAMAAQGVQRLDYNQ